MGLTTKYVVACRNAAGGLYACTFLNEVGTAYDLIIL